MTRPTHHPYAHDGLLTRVLTALREAGIDPEAPAPEALAAVDEFHARGRAVTAELAALAAPQAGERVLDVGCGLGGPARYLAATRGCRVVGIDLTWAFCHVATELSRRTGMAGATAFVQGNALALPMPDASVDCVWTLQAQMNIADKAAFYGELHRVLRPGGRLVFHDLAAGEGGPCLLPAPWATDPAHSHLAPPEALREAIRDAGFHEDVWRDVTADARAWQEAQFAKPRATAPPLLDVVLGDQAAEKRRNAARNLMQGRIAYVQGRTIKPT